MKHFDLPTTNNKQNYSLRQIEDNSPNKGTETSLIANGSVQENIVTTITTASSILKESDIIGFEDDNNRYKITTISDKTITLSSELKTNVESKKIILYNSGEGECNLGALNTQKNYYREYFDILNVPINNEFHLGLIIAGKSATVYINGELNQTQNLFGDPTFNAGPLQINPGQKDDDKDIKLGGVVRDFKFCPKVLSTVDIQNQISNRKSKQEVRLLNQ